MIKYLLTFSLLFSGTVWADTCPDSVQLIHKDEKANCTGFLISPEFEEEISKSKDDLDYYKNLSDKLLERKKLTDKNIDILEKRLDLYIQQSGTLADKVLEKEREDGWQKVLYFSLGVLATGVAVYGAGQLVKR